MHTNGKNAHNGSSFARSVFGSMKKAIATHFFDMKELEREGRKGAEKIVLGALGSESEKCANWAPSLPQKVFYVAVWFSILYIECAY